MKDLFRLISLKQRQHFMLGGIEFAVLEKSSYVMNRRKVSVIPFNSNGYYEDVIYLPENMMVELIIKDK